MVCGKCKGRQFRKHGKAFRAGEKIQKHQCKKCGRIQAEK